MTDTIDSSPRAILADRSPAYEKAERYSPGHLSAALSAALDDAEAATYATIEAARAAAGAPSHHEAETHAVAAAASANAAVDYYRQAAHVRIALAMATRGEGARR